jgi:chromosome partitioning protein
MAKIIALMNQKGGVGKTTTAINLAACLSVAEKKVLLLDLDPQGNASVSLGLRKENYMSGNIYHVLIGQRDIQSCTYQTELPSLDVCPAETNLSGAEVELVSAIAREQKLKMALEQVKHKYDYILIDCPPSLGLLTINALNAANSYIVPMQTEYLSMEGLAQLMNTVQLIKSSLNPGLEMEGIVLTMFDARVSLHKQVSYEVREHFGDMVFKSTIPKNVKLAESPSFGKPVILYDIESKGSDAYLALAKELLLKERSKREESSMNSVQLQ